MDELKKRKIWAGYIPEKKSPLFSLNKDAKSSDINTWQSYEEITSKFGNRRGIFSDGTMLLIDFDHITINGNTPKKVDDKKALMWIKHCPTYLEWSPSGNGIHAIFFLEEKFKLDTHKVDIDNKIGRKYEFWGTEDNRFFTVTEDRINDKEILTITKEKAMQILLDLGYSPSEYTEIKRNESKDDIKVWDWFNQNKNIENLLEPHGWTKVGNGQKQSWLRPGKKKGDGISATFNWNNNHMFRTFSSSVNGFDNEKSYTLFGVYAVLEHNGDIKKAVEQIKKENPDVFKKKEEVINLKEVDMKSYTGEDKIITSLDVYEQIKNKKFEFLDTGFPRLNSEEMTDGGFLENDFIVLSGEAKSGKTELCLQLVEQMEQYNPLFLALEDSVADQMSRKLRKYGSKDIKKYYTFAHTPADGATFDWVQLKIKESIQKHNSKIVFIDNLEWFENEKTGYKAQKEVFKKLKNICDEYKICIVLVVHIKGDSQFAYGTKRPDIQRLKGGSHIYQMATKVIMVWRVKKGKGEERFDAGYTRVILGVDRFSGNNDKDFQLKYTKGKFIELTREEFEAMKEAEPEQKNTINIKEFTKIANYKDDL